MDTIVLNVDGSVLINPRRVSFRGLFQNHDGDFQFGLFGSVGWLNVLHAEIQTFCLESSCVGKQSLRGLFAFHIPYHHYANMLDIILEYMKKDSIFSSVVLFVK